MAQPFQRAQRRGTAVPGSVIRQYRPVADPSLPQAVQDAFRQMPDQIYSLRQQHGPAVVQVQGNGNPITVTTDPLGAGLTLKLTRPGNWVIQAAIALTIAGDPSQIFTASLTCGGGRLGTVANWNSATDGQVMVHQSWNFTSRTGTELVVLLIQKDGGAGTSAVIPGNSTLVATWQGTE